MFQYSRHRNKARYKKFRQDQRFYASRAAAKFILGAKERGIGQELGRKKWRSKVTMRIGAPASGIDNSPSEKS
jgi:hypothetical protein